MPLGSRCGAGVRRPETARPSWVRDSPPQPPAAGNLSSGDRTPDSPDLGAGSGAEGRVRGVSLACCLPGCQTHRLNPGRGRLPRPAGEAGDRPLTEARACPIPQPSPAARFAADSSPADLLASMPYGTAPGIKLIRANRALLRISGTPLPAAVHESPRRPKRFPGGVLTGLRTARAAGQRAARLAWGGSETLRHAPYPLHGHESGRPSWPSCCADEALCAASLD